MRVVCEGQEISSLVWIKTKCRSYHLPRKRILVGIPLFKEPLEEVTLQFAAIRTPKRAKRHPVLPSILYKWSVSYYLLKCKHVLVNL